MFSVSISNLAKLPPLEFRFQEPNCKVSREARIRGRISGVIRCHCFLARIAKHTDQINLFVLENACKADTLLDCDLERFGRSRLLPRWTRPGSLVARISSFGVTQKSR